MNVEDDMLYVTGQEESAAKAPIFILLNGPPRSGKDTIGAALKARLEAMGKRVHVAKFARILKERTHAMYGLDWMAHDAFEGSKDVPSDVFLGKTPRQAYISVSEEYFKVQHGEGIFGRLLAEELQTIWCGFDAPDFCITTDSGFAEEATALMRKFPNSPFHVLQMHRDGCSFSGDSRGYVSPAGCALTFNVLNDTLPARVAEKILRGLGLLPEERFKVERQQCVLDRLEWFQVAGGLRSREGALAAVEFCRQKAPQLVFRITDGVETVIVMPGDAPVADIAVA